MRRPRSPDENSGPPRARSRGGIPVLHPFLIGTAPVIFLLAYNQAEATFHHAWLSIGVIGSVTALLYGSLRAILKDRHKAGLIVFLFSLFFFTYGHVFNLVKGWRNFGPYLAKDRYIFPASLVLLVLGMVVVSRTHRRLNRATLLLNFFAGAMVVIPLVVYLSKSLTEPRYQMADLAHDRMAAPRNAPDIYYIILDGYGRADVLKEIYEIDNREFISNLSDAGFFVASKSAANYSQTRLSVASSLNLTHLNDLAEQVGLDSSNAAPLRKMIQRSRVVTLLGDAGYRFISFSSGAVYTELWRADTYLRPPVGISEFNNILLNTTPIPLLARYLREGSGVRYAWHRSRIGYILDTLPTIADDPALTFTFAHILSPHPPFVFDADGSAINPPWPFSLKDGSSWTAHGASRKDYIDGYRNQLLYLNGRIAETIKEILARSAEPPIIVLQADHGPGARLSWLGLEHSDPRERMSILNAYHLPGGREELLYDTITPVNSFRLIFNAYFGTNYEMLDDTSYFSLWDTPYRFTDVTERVNPDGHRTPEAAPS